MTLVIQARPTLADPIRASILAVVNATLSRDEFRVNGLSEEIIAYQRRWYAVLDEASAALSGLLAKFSSSRGLLGTRLGTLCSGNTVGELTVSGPDWKMLP